MQFYLYLKGIQHEKLISTNKLQVFGNYQSNNVLNMLLKPIVLAHRGAEKKKRKRKKASARIKYEAGVCFFFKHSGAQGFKWGGRRPEPKALFMA